MSFTLKKWYLDVTAPDGSYLIFYLGQLIFKSVNVGFSHRLGGGRLAKLSSGPKLTVRSAPDIDAHGKVVIAEPGSDLSAEWIPDGASSSHTLFSSATGEVRWNCLQPAARVTVNHEGSLHVGRGYVEHLTLTLPPWDLGLEHLDWGRYVSDADQVTWIRWRGDHPLELAIVNGEVSSRVSVNGDRVLVGDRTLHLADTHVIRDGKLGSTVLNKLPGLLPLAPLQILRLHERKWLSRGRLNAPDGSASDGWAIHEQVAWPAPATCA